MNHDLAPVVSGYSMDGIASKVNSDKRSASTPSDLPYQQSEWSWCAKLGVVLVIFGILAISLIALRNVDSVASPSWLIVLSGVVEAVHAFHLRKSAGFFFHLVPGIAGVPLGLLVATHPDAGLVTWMLVFASFFTIVGLFRLVAAFRLKFPAWPWGVLDSVVTLVLGCIFWTAWTWLGTWFFDIAVGVSLILRGVSSVMFGLALHRRAPVRTQFSPASNTAKTHAYQPGLES